jgi:hypothetical protein
MLAVVLTYGAAVTSLGLALATWIRRLGRAAATSAAVYALVTAGWLAVVALLFPGGGGHETFKVLGSASPFFGPGELAFETGSGYAFGHQMNCYVYLPIWIAFYIAAALILYWLTLYTFDRCLGRVQDSLPHFAGAPVFDGITSGPPRLS